MAYFNKGPRKLCGSGIDVNCEAGIVATCDDPNTNQHFNACLIAASPDMYEALKEWSALEEVMKECRKCYDMPIGQQYCADHYDALTDLRKKRDAALLKAEGREV